MTYMLEHIRIARGGRALVALVAAFASAVLAVPAAADYVIETPQIFNRSINPFGAPNSATFGQTFKVGAPESRLQSFSLFLGPRRNGSAQTPLQFRGYLGEWKNGRLKRLLYESDTITRNPPPSEEFLYIWQEYSFDTAGLKLKPNHEYVAFLSISALGPQTTSGFGMPSPGFDALTPGQFVYLNNGVDFARLYTDAWRSFGDVLGDPLATGDDVWFSARLTTKRARAKSR